MDYETFQTLIATVDAAVQNDLAAGHPEAAVARRETLLVLVGPALMSAEDPAPAWIRAARVISDTSTPGVLDALEAAPARRLQSRINALHDVPPLAAIGALAEMHEVIGRAIAIGAPRYNGGDIRGCCTVYWATTQALVLAPVFRGFPNYARAVAALRPVLDGPLPGRPLDPRGTDDLAWSLRHAMDAVLAM